MFYVKETNREIDLALFGYGKPPVYHGYRANGTETTPQTVKAFDLVFGIGARTWIGNSFTNHSTAAIHMVALEDHTESAQGTDFRILVTPVGSTHAGRKIAVQYLASPTGMRCRMRMSGPDNERMMLQTDEVGSNTSVTAIPNGGFASNFQARDSHTPNFSRVYLEANADGHRLVSDARGDSPVKPLSIDIGQHRSSTYHVNGVVTYYKGIQFGVNAPVVLSKSIKAKTSSIEGGSISIPHGLDSLKILSLNVIVRPVSTPSEGVIPNSTIAGREYSVYFNNTSVVISNHTTNSANILNSDVTCYIVYEV